MDQNETIFDTLIKYAIPISNFLIALIASFFSASTFFKTRAKLKIDFLEQKQVQYLVDRGSDEEPDPYWQAKYRYFPKVVLSNNSSHPITIYGFILNGDYLFDIDSEYGEHYTTTTTTNRTEKNGIISVNMDPITKLKIPLSNTQVLKPVFTLKPFESCSGYLFFWYDEALPEKNKLTIRTSRKNFSKTVKVDDIQKSVNPHSYEPPPLDTFDRV